MIRFHFISLCLVPNEGLLCSVSPYVLFQLALLPEHPATHIARELVADKHLVDRSHVSHLVLGDRSAQVAHPRLHGFLDFFWCSWNATYEYNTSHAF